MAKRWYSFKKKLKDKKPLTFATVVMRANEVREVELSGLFDDITAPIEVSEVLGEEDNKNKVTDMPSLIALGKRLSKISLSVVPEVKRQVMASYSKSADA